MQEKQKVRKEKRRIFLGCGDFSYPRAFFEKRSEEDQPKWARHMIVSEYQSQEQLTQRLGEQFLKNKRYLESKNISMLFGVDATKLQEHEELKKYHLAHIHFNFPHSGDAYTDKLVAKALLSFAAVQQLEDTVYIALVDRKGKKGWWHGYIYNIVEAISNAGYIYHRKRSIRERIQGYTHTQTKRKASSENAKFGKIFVFKKTDRPYEEVFAFNEKYVKARKTHINKKPITLKYFDVSTSQGSHTYGSEMFDSLSQSPRQYQTPESFGFEAESLDFNLTLNSQPKESFMQQKKEKPELIFDRIAQHISSKNVDGFKETLESAIKQGFDINFQKRQSVKVKALKDHGVMGDKTWLTDQQLIAMKQSLAYLAVHDDFLEGLRLLKENGANFDTLHSNVISYTQNKSDNFSSVHTCLTNQTREEPCKLQPSQEEKIEQMLNPKKVQRQSIGEQAENSEEDTTDTASSSDMNSREKNKENRLLEKYKKYKKKYRNSKKCIALGEITIDNNNADMLLEKTMGFFAEKADVSLNEYGKRKFDEIQADAEEQLYEKRRRVEESIGKDSEKMGQVGEIYVEAANLIEAGLFASANRCFDRYLEPDTYYHEESESSSDTSYSSST